MSKATIDIPTSGRDLDTDARAALPELPPIPPDLPPDLLVTPKWYAAYTGTTEAQLAQQRYRGDGPKFVKFGRSVRYRWSDILSYIEANTRQQSGD